MPYSTCPMAGMRAVSFAMSSCTIIRGPTSAVRLSRSFGARRAEASRTKPRKTRGAGAPAPQTDCNLVYMLQSRRHRQPNDLSGQRGDEFLDAEQEDPCATDQEVRRGRREQRICSCKNPAPENSRNKGR